MSELLREPMLLPIGIPLLAGLLCLVVPRRAVAWWSVVAAVATLVTAWPVFANGEQTLEHAGWLSLRVDGLSGFVLLAASFFATLIAIYSLGYMREHSRERAYYACLLATLSFAGGVLLANDLLLLLTCWGLLAITLYLMIGVAGEQASEASRKTLVIVGGSDAVLLIGVVLLWIHNGSTRMDLGAVGLNSVGTFVAFLCFAAAAFAKAGVIPLHSWVPDCAEKAPVPVVAYLPASLDKLLGIYLLARAARGLFVMNEQMNTVLMLFGALTVIGGVMMALVQHDLKRLMSFHAVSQVGYMVMGIASGTVVGLAGGLFHMLNHAIYKSGLFLVAGVVEKKTGSTNLDQLGGLATRLPFTFAACLVASLAIAGVPPLNGFASKWMVYQGLVEGGLDQGSMLWVLWLSAAMLGSALTLASFVKVLHSVFLCKPSPQIRATEIRRAGWTALLPLGILSALCVLFGVLAHRLPIPAFIEPAVGEALSYPGAWWAGRISLLLLVTFALGWGYYALTMRNGKLRECPTFIGGERMSETRLPGVPRGPNRHVEVTGVDFYQTVEDLPLLKSLYAAARRKLFDIYYLSGRGLGWLAKGMQRAHTGLLSLYTIWFVLGLLLILYVMSQGTLDPPADASFSPWIDAGAELDQVGVQ